jgi:hypothetical protein
MSQSSINPTVILNELRSSEVKLLFGHLKILSDHLEEKNDPDPIEMEIVDASYQLIEKIQLFESVMREYARESANELLGNKLTELYNSGRVKGGTSTLFKT